MSRHYTISIPVKPHIRKFFNRKEGNPIMAINRSMVWMVIRPYLIYKIKDIRSVLQREKQLCGLSDKIIIQLSISNVKSYGLHIEKSNIILVNQFLDHYFAKELYWHLIACRSNPGRYKGYKKAIESFCEKFGIQLEEDISLKALEKMYERHRKYENIIGVKNGTRI